MKKIFTVTFLAIALTINFSPRIYSQNDCCGLGSIFSSLFQSGVFGGYGIQKFSAKGFNHYIDVYNENRSSTLTKKMDHFDQVTGFKVGANVFQILVNDILLGMKVSYQWMKSKNEATAMLNGGTARREYDLTLKTFGIGFSLAYYASKNFDIKIVDAFLTWNSADLVNRLIEPNVPVSEEKLTNPDNSIGFSAGTGITFYPLPPYLSFEGSVGYSFFSINEMEFNNGSRLIVDENTLDEMTDFIDAGGLFATIQLNVAIPLN